MSLRSRIHDIFAPSANRAPMNPGGEYEPDRRDRYLVVSGIKFTPTNLLSYLIRAEAGDTRFLYAFYDEMVARDSHLAAELAKAKGALTGAHLDINAYPVKYRKGMKGKQTPGTKEELPVTITKYVEDQLRAPGIRIDRAISALSDGLWKGVGAVEVQWEPRGAKLENGQAVDRISGLIPIPSQRFRFDPFGTEMLFQHTGDPTDLDYVRDIGDRLAVMVGDANRPSPARRGLLRLCMAAWITRMYGPGWWQRFVELFGSPMRVAKVDASDDETRKELNAALSQLATHSYAIVPTNVQIEFVEAAARSLSAPPHQTLLDWCADEISKAILGATQTTDIKPNAGSKASADVHLDVFDRLSANRAQEIAGCIREQIVMPLVSRNFGPDNAALYCPEIVLNTEGRPDFAAFSTAIKTWRDAGLGETTPVAWAHETMGIPMADEDDETLGATPAPTLLGQPGEPGAEPGGKVVPFKPKVDGAIQEKSKTEGGQPTEGPQATAQGKATEAPGEAFAAGAPSDEVYDELKRSAIARKFHSSAGDDIVGPVRDIIDRAVKEGQSLHTVLAKIRQRMGLAVQAPETRDFLAAVIAEATFRGLTSARRERHVSMSAGVAGTSLAVAGGGGARFYSENQPRIPAGSPEGGEWGSGGGGKAARSYRRSVNEGGEGYNPHQVASEDAALGAEAARVKSTQEKLDAVNREIERADSSVARESGTYDAAKVAALEAQRTVLTAQVKAEFLQSWTRATTEARRAEWNARVRAGEFGRPGSGKTDSRAVAAAEKKQGWSLSDLKKAIGLHGLS